MSKKPIHDIWNGDCIELVRRFKPGRVDCLITDPPFGVDNHSRRAVTEAGKEYSRKIANDSSVEIALEIFSDMFVNLHDALSPVADVYIFTAPQVIGEWQLHCDLLLGKFGYKRKALIVWDKCQPGMGDLNSPWSSGFELILFYQRGRVKTATRSQAILSQDKLWSKKLIHPHEKPTALLERLIKASTGVGDFIVDPFAGSGSLVRAARACGRDAIGIELDEKNWQIAKKELESSNLLF